MNCRRCDSERLLELARLDGRDYTVYRCRDCGFLFSPPEQEARAAGRGAASPPAPPQSPVAIRRRPAAR